MQEKIIDEILEVGEIPLFILIPLFLETQNGYYIKYPTTAHSENYEIESTDFLKLLLMVLELILYKEYGLFYYQAIVTENDDLHLVSPLGIEQILLNRESWIYGEGKVHYFLSTQE